MNTSTLSEPWRFGQPYTNAMRSIIERRYRIMPHLYGLFAADESRSAPVLAPTFFHFPSDEQPHALSAALTDQALLARSLDADILGDAGGWTYDDESSHRVIVQLLGSQDAQTVCIGR